MESGKMCGVVEFGELISARNRFPLGKRSLSRFFFFFLCFKGFAGLVEYVCLASTRICVNAAFLCLMSFNAMTQTFFRIKITRWISTLYWNNAAIKLDYNYIDINTTMHFDIFIDVYQRNITLESRSSIFSHCGRIQFSRFHKIKRSCKWRS